MSNNIPVAPTRSELRNKLLSRHAPKSEQLNVFGVDIEIRQPTLDAILSAREEADVKTRTVDMIIRYAYVPGTDEPIFENGDRDTILQWPFGSDLVRVQQAITKLTGVDIAEAKQDLKSDPLDEQS